MHATLEFLIRHLILEVVGGVVKKPHTTISDSLYKAVQAFVFKYHISLPEGFLILGCVLSPNTSPSFVNKYCHLDFVYMKGI